MPAVKTYYVVPVSISPLRCAISSQWTRGFRTMHRLVDVTVRENGIYSVLDRVAVGRSL